MKGVNNPHIFWKLAVRTVLVTGALIARQTPENRNSCENGEKWSEGGPPLSAADTGDSFAYMLYTNSGKKVTSLILVLSF